MYIRGYCNSDLLWGDVIQTICLSQQATYFREKLSPQVGVCSPFELGNRFLKLAVYFGVVVRHFL